MESDSTEGLKERTSWWVIGVWLVFTIFTELLIGLTGYLISHYAPTNPINSLLSDLFSIIQVLLTLYLTAHYITMHSLVSYERIKKISKLVATAYFVVTFTLPLLYLLFSIVVISLGISSLLNFVADPLFIGAIYLNPIFLIPVLLLEGFYSVVVFFVFGWILRRHIPKPVSTSI